MAKIGILGGTFDPIHLGHLQMAEEAYRQARLDQVLFMLSKIPPHKQDREIAIESHRAAMVQLAIRDKPEFAYSDFELRREGTTYTADTLRMLQKQYPEQEYYFILGGDSLFHIGEWYQPEEIMKRAVILAISRYGMNREEMKTQIERLEKNYRAQIQIVDMPRMDISSSEIRKKVQQGQNLQNLVPKIVETYIMSHKLYQLADDGKEEEV